MNINNENIKSPSLIEPGVYYFLNETLKKCHKFREKYNNIIFNIILFIIFILIISIWLFISYKGKITEEERIQREEEKKKYILSKIHNYKNNKLKEEQNLITGLPYWNDEL